MDFDDQDVTDVSQIDDRRGLGRGGTIGVGVGGAGIVGVIIALLTTLLGGGGGGVGGIDDLNNILNGAAPGAQTSDGAPSAIGQSCASATSTSDDATFIACVQNNVQRVWTDLFSADGKTYTPAKLVLFTAATQSPCGTASAQTGPFYCPADHEIYLDLGFFDELRRRFGATGGDFAQAYVVAHEYAHHVQSLLGIEAQVRRQQQANPSKANDYSVRLELQADCFAGVWGHAAYAAGKVPSTEVKQALDAAAAVGDDRIQQAATGRVSPESFTHGTSAQRQKWFSRGFDSGRPDDCDTFNSGV